MAKPRIILADEDTNYIITLQYKFVIEFFEKIDLEIISERSYFNEYFSKPQNAEVLIVSEDLYEPSLKKHNITNIFVMSENPDEGQTGELNINRLFKYTSIKEIFNEIIGKSSEALHVASTEKKETQIILVTSATGGVGKTTMAMGVAACLSKNYKRVLYINASRLQNFQYLLDNTTAISSPEVYYKLLNPAECIYEEVKHVVRKEVFSYLPPFKASLLSIGVSFAIYEKIAISAKQSAEFDFIVIDAESTFDEYKTRMIDISDKVIVVTNQTLNGVYATNSLVSNLNGTNSDKFIFVCNKFQSENYNALISPDIPIKYLVNEYVEKYKNNKIIKVEELLTKNEIRKVAFLVI